MTAQAEHKSFGTPDETRPFPRGGVSQPPAAELDGGAGCLASLG
jgi:hypothetical protein